MPSPGPSPTSCHPFPLPEDVTGENWDKISSDANDEFDGDPREDVPVPFEASQAGASPAWVHYLQNTDPALGWHEENSQHQGSQKLRLRIARAGDLEDCAKKALKAIRKVGLDLPTLLYAMAASSNSTLANVRGFLVGHPDFPIIMEALDKHSIRVLEGLVVT
jgi:hypothetical protein